MVPMNPLLKGREVKFYVEDPGAKLLFAWGDFEDAASQGAEEGGAELDARQARRVRGARRGATSPTPTSPSATTTTPPSCSTPPAPPARPRAPSSRTPTCARTASSPRARWPQATEEDVLLGALPLFHSFGQTCGLNGAVSVGACLSMIPRFDPAKALEIIERDKVTIFQGVPTMYHAMLNCDAREDADVSSLRACMSGGAAMPVEVMKEFEEAFGCEVLEGYGLSETSPVASFNQPGQERKPGSIGTPIEGVEMKLVDDDGNDVEGTGEEAVGEIAIQRPQHHEGLLGQGGRHQGGPRRRRLVPLRATWPTSTTTATSSSSTARRT